MKRILAAYLVVIHLAFACAAWKFDALTGIRTRLGFDGTPQPSELTSSYHRNVAYHSRSCEIVPEGSVLFIGDNLTQAQCVTAVVPNGINYGICCDTTVGVIERLDDYEPALIRASGVVLAIGINDLRRRSDDDILKNFARILDHLERFSARVYVSSILPINETAVKAGYAQRVFAINNRLAALCATRGTVFIDNTALLDQNGNGTLDRVLQTGDGVHLNSEGNAMWAASLRRNLK